MATKLSKRDCDRCGTTYQPKTSRVLHCNREWTRSCPIPECGKEFTTRCSFKPKEYCSHSCSTSPAAVILRNTNQRLKDHPLWGEVDPDLNDLDSVAILPVNVSVEVWWKAKDCGHAWRARVNVRSSADAGCSICGDREVLAGFNDIATKWPHFVNEWDYKANGVAPTEVLHTYDKPVGWRCVPHDHTWEAKAKDRSKRKNGGCPYCEGRVVLSGFNDFASRQPELMEEWDWVRNELDPTQILNGLAHWICKKHGHRFTLTISQRLRGTSCPICADRIILPGFNDLATLYPEIAARWSPANELDASSVSPKTNTKYLWDCPSKHRVSLSPSNQVKYGLYCSVCNNTEVQAGVNDLLTLNPISASWWADEHIDPTEVTPVSTLKVRWQCERCPKMYREMVTTQAKRSASLCRGCSKNYSYLETAVELYLNKLGIEVEARKLVLRDESGAKLQLDLMLPQHGLAIEVQDFATHSRAREGEPTDLYWQKRHVMVKKGPAYHELKRSLAREQLSLTLIDIWEDEIRDGSFQKRLNSILGVDARPELVEK